MATAHVALGARRARGRGRRQTREGAEKRQRIANHARVDKGSPSCVSLNSGTRRRPRTPLGGAVQQAPPHAGWRGSDRCARPLQRSLRRRTGATHPGGKCRPERGAQGRSLVAFYGQPQPLPHLSFFAWVASLPRVPQSARRPNSVRPPPAARLRAGGLTVGTILQKRRLSIARRAGDPPSGALLGTTATRSADVSVVAWRRFITRRTGSSRRRSKGRASRRSLPLRGARLGYSSFGASMTQRSVAPLPIRQSPARIWR